MELHKRIDVLIRLGKYIMGNDPEWIETKQKAFAANNWFIPEFINLSVKNIGDRFLNEEQLLSLAITYTIPELNLHPKKIGIVMAGNIPLVGFHDLLCTFLTGHFAHIKPSSKDEVLIKHILIKLQSFSAATQPYFVLEEMLKGCDAYIATGSNNSSRYFDFYFGKYPHIIRRNRTSVAILTGKETINELEQLADDVHQYFGLGCRNVTKLYVPENYNFIPLLEAFKKYSFFENHNKYRNNYEHNLAIHIMNNRYYMTNGSSILLVEDKAIFSPIAQLNYEFYAQLNEVENALNQNKSIQCIVGMNQLPFGSAQYPGVEEYADGIDTIKFLLSINN